MSVQKYRMIKIEDVVDLAIKNFKQTGYSNDCVGTCGIGQASVYYAAIKLGVPEDCIKLCQASDIVRGTAHTFVILILDIPYLVDLTFDQFLCYWEEDKHSQRIHELFPIEKIEKFQKERYTELSEPFLIVYYTMLTRYCVFDYPRELNLPFDKIELYPNDEKYKKEGKVNFLTLTLLYDWSSYKVDYSIENIKEYGWDSWL